MIINQITELFNMKSKNILILPIILLLSSSLLASDEFKLEESQIIQRIADSRVAMAEVQTDINQNSAAKALVDRLNQATQMNESAHTQYEQFKLDHRTYVQAALSFAKQNKQLAAVVTVSVLAGILIQKIFFTPECSSENNFEEDDFFEQNGY